MFHVDDYFLTLMHTCKLKPELYTEMYMILEYFFLCSFSADSGDLDMQALGVSVPEQSLLLDPEKAQRTKMSAVCESAPSVNVAARGKCLVSVRNHNVHYAPPY